MYRSLNNSFIVLATLVVLTGACAKVGTPSGGPRDRQPPVVVECVPENGAKNFKGKNLSVKFDEYVVLDNINEKLMVSPPLENKPQILIKGRGINIEFEDELKDSTTYTFYFQDAIRDLNEGNIIENYQFVFSTGPVIDSLSVTGNVFYSFNLEVPEKTMVLMYRDLSDSAVIKNLPDYISRVDQNGYFRINNVRSGRYRLFALADVDNSKNYNLIEEEFAFMDFPVDITTEKNFLPLVEDTTSVEMGLDTVSLPTVSDGEFQLLLFAAEKKDHYLTGSSRDQKYQMNYTLSLPPDTLKFEFSIPETSDDSYYTEMSKNRDTLTVWLTDSALYSQQQIETRVRYPFTDSVGTLGYKEDTIPMRFIEPRAPRSAKVIKPVFNINTNIINSNLKPGQQVVFSSLTPFRMPDTTCTELYEIVDSISTKVPYSFVRDSTNSCRYLLNSTLLPGKKYLLIADSASFGNIYGENIDSTAIRFSIRDIDFYNKLTLNISNTEGDQIIQLLDINEKLISESKISGDGILEFPLLEEGFYRMRSIYDLNGDGKWTTGDFETGQQPEPVSYYPADLEIETGFYLEQDWDLRVRNFKDKKLKAKKTTGR